MRIKPRVSIGVPVYNGARFLASTLDSLLRQTYQDFELIISDNASTDATADICKEYLARDPRVRYERNPENRGAAWNINRVAELATGEYFKWAMADDLCEPELVERCVEILDRDPSIVLACCRTRFIDEQGALISEFDPGWDLQSELAHERLRRVISVGGHWANADALAGVIRRDALLRTRLIPRYQGGDKRPLAELSLLGKFAEIPEHMYIRRQHPDCSAQNNPDSALDTERALDWMEEFFKASRAEVSRPTWILMSDYLQIVFGSGLKSREKLSLTVSILQCMRWNWRRLMREVVSR